MSCVRFSKEQTVFGISVSIALHLSLHRSGCNPTAYALRDSRADCCSRPDQQTAPAPFAHADCCSRPVIHPDLHGLDKRSRLRGIRRLSCYCLLLARVGWCCLLLARVGWRCLLLARVVNLSCKNNKQKLYYMSCTTKAQEIQKLGRDIYHFFLKTYMFHKMPKSSGCLFAIISRAFRTSSRSLSRSLS